MLKLAQLGHRENPQNQKFQKSPHHPQFRDFKSLIQEKSRPDFTLDQSYAAQLRTRCPQSGGDQNLFLLDFVSPATFDNAYFKNLLSFKGLLNSDQVLVNKNQESLELVKRRIKDQDKDGDSVHDDVESLRGKPHSGPPSNLAALVGNPTDRTKWKRKSVVTLSLTVLTSSQAILIVWSKRAGKYEYSVTTANFLVETLKCALSVAALARIWRNEGVTDDNRLSTTWDEVSVYPIPAVLYLIKNLLQYYIFAYVDAPGYQILKNFNIISTGVLYRIILKRKLSEIQWAAFILLCSGCTTAQLNSSSDKVLQTPLQGWVMAIAIIKKRPSRNINVQNFWLYVFGMIFNTIAIVVQDFDAVMNKGFFHGYSFITVLMILNHALSGIAVSMVMKYADNIVKVYSTSVAMLLTAVVSVFLFGFHLSLAFFLGSTVVSVSVYLHSIGKLQ
ncbi:hypothetical protein C2S51_006316 [Perilla frutescens var. frutescens]|nr:hypothetical protein C2S51_006316 [Perilla frutescens var. frutescens]